MRLFTNKTFRACAAVVLLAGALPSFNACNDDVGVKIERIEFDKDCLSFGYRGGEETATVKATVSGLSVSGVNASWCTIDYKNGVVHVVAEQNESTAERHAFVKIEGEGISQTLAIRQAGRKLTLGEGDTSYDYLKIFTDKTCTKLRPEITEAEIEEISSAFFRELARDIQGGKYDTEFRVREYKPWQEPYVMAAKNKTRRYSKRDNPTGIYAQKGEQVVFFAGDIPAGTHVYVFLQNANERIEGYTKYVEPGLNTFTAQYDGLMYVEYLTVEAKEAPVKIHFATCNVNGFFDTAIHSPGEWKERLDKAGFRHFDLLGERAHMTFETEMFRRYTPDGTELVSAYDRLVYLEHDFMGLFKYGKEFRNRMYFLVMDHDNYMHATDYYTGYSLPTQSEILDVEQFKTTAIWGPAHEVGHVNQTRGLDWHGMTEVTNNIYSLYVQTEFGNTSRLLDGDPNSYERAKTSIIEAGIAHNALDGEPILQVVPFWQLKLYMMDALGKKDFYRDLFEHLRTSPDSATDGAEQLNFVKVACQISQLDLTDFFRAWGFLTEINKEKSDYNDKTFVVTQEMIDAVEAEIEAMKLPKPRHNNIYDITDENVSDFK
ncbi:M60 family metallopeptidase [Alistipes sp. OttesenSCG-928-B03]|nr:M60 family metallopeptidase [Alistipes sp. OttesenSCG-928-B03]